MGWASQAPQQHALIFSQRDHAETVVALNSSANYLGSAVGSMIGGFVLFAGLRPSQLPFAAGCLVLVAFWGQLILMLINKKEVKRVKFATEEK